MAVPKSTHPGLKVHLATKSGIRRSSVWHRPRKQLDQPFETGFEQLLDFQVDFEGTFGEVRDLGGHLVYFVQNLQYDLQCTPAMQSID